MSDQVNLVNVAGEIIEKKVCAWTIDIFTHIVQGSIKSPKFNVIINKKITTWQLELYPNGDEQDISDLAKLRIIYLSDADAFVNISFAVGNHNQDTPRLYTDYCLFTSPYEYYSKFLPNGWITFGNGHRLTIECEVILDQSEKYFQKIKNAKVEEFDDFRMLFGNPKLSDVQFVFPDRQLTLYAHLYVLSQKSTYFSSIFKENKEVKVMKVTHASYEAMFAMLEVVYTGDIYFHEEKYKKSTYLELLKLSQRYGVQDLKALCENNIIIENLIDIENAVEFLEIADASNLLRLRTEAINFIARNAKVIVAQEKFKAIANPKLLHDVVQNMF